LRVSLGTFEHFSHTHSLTLSLSLTLVRASSSTHRFILACYRGRNKLLADKAYELYNAEIADTHLKIFTPETIRDVRKAEIPLWIERFGGHGVVKVPYSNAGQGVYTITNEHELADFMAESFDYDQFIVQSLIGNFNWRYALAPLVVVVVVPR